MEQGNADRLSRWLEEGSAVAADLDEEADLALRLVRTLRARARAVRRAAGIKSRHRLPRSASAIAQDHGREHAA